MKNLVSSILFAAVVSQAAGCIFVSDDDPPVGDLGAISVSWTLKSTNPAVPGNPDVAAACPAGADTARLFALPVGADPSTAFEDQFDCVDGRGTIADLEPGSYLVWVQLSDFNLTTRFAESLSQQVDVFANNTATASRDIYVDRGFFFVGWNLTGRVTSCAAASGNDGVSILSTDGGGAGFDTVVDCVEGEGVRTFSQPLPVSGANARYTTVLSLVNTAGQSLGDSQPISNRTFQNYGGANEDLGIVPINVR